MVGKMIEFKKYSFVCDSCERDEIIPPRIRHHWLGNLCKGKWQRIEWIGKVV